MNLKPIFAAALMAAILPATAQQHTCDRIEKMPAIPQPYKMRPWKDVARGYVDLVLNPATGEHMPLSSQQGAGNNYPAFEPLRLDTYVGWNAHASGSEAINTIPAVVTAYLVGAEDRSAYRLTEGIMDFFNAKNRQNVYLNSFSAASGHDWWYDLMPNVYFYQLYALAPMPDEALAREQYISVADRWLEAVYALGGTTYEWKAPSMGYRAFDLMTMKPLDSGVKEPESAGTIAWLLFHAWQRTGEEKYRLGAELAMEYLSGLGSNPAYELQLAYGVQAAAKMNAMLGTAYRTEKLFDNCFDRGYLRGWGAIVGQWGGYDVSGLIGEANDKGNDYAFVMNGFQQVAALAPAVKYDKRLARAYGRWVLNVANASRLFYPGFLPDANMEQESLKWSKTYDKEAVIPYESMKEVWNGARPFAMGDAVGGKWAATNLSLYSGSSVGYMAAVVETTDVEAILRLDLNATDLDGTEKLPTYLYYNPYTSVRTVSVPLPAGSFDIYDAITEKTLVTAAKGTYRLTVPADGVCMVTLIPAGTQLRTERRLRYAGDKVVDWHVGGDFDALMRVKNVEPSDPMPVRGADVTVRATVGAMPADAVCSWTLDGKALNAKDTSAVISTSGLAEGTHTVVFEVKAGGRVDRASTTFSVLLTEIHSPEILGLTSSTPMPATPGAVLAVDCSLSYPAEVADVVWSADGGTIANGSDKTQILWTMPAEEGVYTLACEASNVKGTAKAELKALVRASEDSGARMLAHFAFDGNLDEASGAVPMEALNGTPGYSATDGGSGLTLDGRACAAWDAAEAHAPSGSITISFWARPEEWTSGEQFVVSHGSWQDRYKMSITPEHRMRWTVKTSDNTVDVDDPDAMAKGVFRHYTAVYTGFSLEIYRYGILRGFAPLTGSLGTTAHAFTVGAMTPADMSYNFRGTVDELRIYDGALSPDEILRAYRAEAMAAGVDAPGSDGDAKEATVEGIYTIDGRSSAGTEPGLYIVRYRRADGTVFCRKEIVKP